MITATGSRNYRCMTAGCSSTHVHHGTVDNKPTKSSLLFEDKTNLHAVVCLSTTILVNSFYITGLHVFLYLGVTSLPRISLKMRRRLASSNSSERRSIRKRKSNKVDYIKTPLQLISLTSNQLFVNMPTFKSVVRPYVLQRRPSTSRVPQCCWTKATNCRLKL